MICKNSHISNFAGNKLIIIVEYGMLSLVKHIKRILDLVKKFNFHIIKSNTKVLNPKLTIETEIFEDIKPKSIEKLLMEKINDLNIFSINLYGANTVVVNFSHKHFYND